jgi:hypothetical protein
MELKELNEGQAFALTSEQVKERKQLALDSVSSHQLVQYAKAGMRFVHVTELDHRPIEYYEFFWVNR